MALRARQSPSTLMLPVPGPDHTLTSQSSLPVMTYRPRASHAKQYTASRCPRKVLRWRMARDASEAAVPESYVGYDKVG